MSENNLLCRKKPRKPHYTTDSKHPYKKYTNLLKNLKDKEKEKVLVGDITSFSMYK